MIKVSNIKFLNTRYSYSETILIWYELSALELKSKTANLQIIRVDKTLQLTVVIRNTPKSSFWTTKFKTSVISFLF